MNRAFYNFVFLKTFNVVMLIGMTISSWYYPFPQKATFEATTLPLSRA